MLKLLTSMELPNRLASCASLCSSQVGIFIDDDARNLLNDCDVFLQLFMDLSILANVKLAWPTIRWNLAALTKNDHMQRDILMVLSFSPH